MKKMKFVLVACLGFSTVFMACEKSSNTVNPGVASALDLSSNSALTDFVFLATADSSKNTHAKEVVTPIAITALPAAITTYITANYSGSTVTRAGTLANGNYIVGVLKSDKTHVGLVFDAAGKFLEAKAPKNNNLTPVNVADLPAGVSSYVKANYSGATINNAMKTVAGDLVIMITKSDATKALLAFTSAGVFKSEITFKPGKIGNNKMGKVVAIADLPTKITSYIASNYAGAVIDNAITGPFGDFIVQIKKADGTKLALVFKKDGSFVTVLAIPTKK